MSKFKVGDIIEIINDESYYYTKKGLKGTIKSIHEDNNQIMVYFDYPHDCMYHVYSSDVKLISSTIPSLPSLSRKDRPVFSGVLQYFPDAIMEISHHSKKGNDKHNPGQPLHWAKEKSKDHADCIARHLIDIGPNWDAIDPETGSYHAAALAWRALALLQTLLEKKK